MAGRGPDFIREQMRAVRKLTDGPFGVDLLAASPESLTASVDVIIEEGASAFVAGLGVPMPIMERLKKAGLKVMVVCGAVKHAVKAEQAGCDAVICQGGEGGGHTGLVGTLPLVAQAVEAVKVPVVAAGGLYDGRGLAASLALGAVGVWMGTRFIASEEAHAGELYRQTIVESADEDTVRTRCYSGKPMRVRKNPYVEDWESRPADIQPFPVQAGISIQNNAMGGIGGQTETPTRVASPWARAPAGCTMSCRPAISCAASWPRRRPPSAVSPRSRAGNRRPPDAGSKILTFSAV
jgi:enoyl-[acyl-carrier protein] reductase II